MGSRRKIAEGPPPPITTSQKRNEKTFENDPGTPEVKLPPGEKQPKGTRFNPEIPYETADNAAWHRLPDEPVDWYKRFLIYLSLPSNKRSIPEAYRRYQAFLRKKATAKNAPGAWATRAREWRWYDRAKEYEIYDLEQERYAIEKMKSQLKTARLASLKNMYTKLIKKLDHYDLPEPDPEKPNEFKTMAHFTQAISLLIKMNEAIMRESGDTPIQRTQFVWDKKDEKQDQFNQEAFKAVFGTDDGAALLQKYVMEMENDEENEKDE